jgi:uncharacterized RDD family membrane protein YckC
MSGASRHFSLDTMEMEPEVSTKLTPPGLWRRFGAVVYDGLLLTAVLFAATAVLLPFTGGEAVRPSQGWYTAYLVLVSFGYFGWFWTHGGQTLGMRTWNLRLVGAGSNGATWPQALVRFAGACLSWLALGMGFLWMLVDRDRQTWHDHLSNTRIVDTS